LINQAQKAALELRIRQPECPPIEDRSQRRDALQAGPPVNEPANRLRIHQAEFVGLIRRRFQLFGTRLACQIHQGASG
jgi:hypothetical protein